MVRNFDYFAGNWGIDEKKNRDASRVRACGRAGVRVQKDVCVYIPFVCCVLDVALSKLFVHLVGSFLISL